MKNQLSDGQLLPYVVPVGKSVKSGDAVVVSALVGVAVTDGAEGERVPLATVGVFTLIKGTGAISQGAKVYASVDAQSGEVTMVTTASGNTLAGIAWADAAAGDAFVNVKLK
jgi:predicted RecA/RadA family phage recombinase